MTYLSCQASSNANREVGDRARSGLRFWGSQLRTVEAAYFGELTAKEGSGTRALLPM